MSSHLIYRELLYRILILSDIKYIRALVFVADDTYPAQDLSITVADRAKEEIYFPVVTS